jgi:hypothetical protein
MRENQEQGGKSFFKKPQEIFGDLGFGASS